VAKGIGKESYRRAVLEILGDPRLSFTEAKPLIELCQAPAAPRKHHFFTDAVSGGYRARDDWYLSHDYAVVAELARRGAPDELIRVVSEAHGLAPFSTLEGLIVHLADSADARFGEFIQGALLSKLRDVEKEGCSVYKALDELVKKKGLKTAVQLMLQSIDKLAEEAKKLCKLQTE